ncbi:hypothetical protein NWFMUON74_02190 [Nocardia wallacei]|uniref:Uncharacterized protein n=1 Tax=Nocardia wallacei TaxID=480035 RepID=A0A7G1KB68_9NOCA|nr:hypothetical protein NWFMUON74_02190 [Nocardia wallacei]
MEFIRGCKLDTDGTLMPFRINADTLANIASFIGATPDDLRSAKRMDAAAKLENDDPTNSHPGPLPVLPEMRLMPLSVVD